MKPPPEPAAGLDLIKPAVREQPPYSLKAYSAARKLNQNESPYDLPAALKREIADRLTAVPWNRYPEFTPGPLLDLLAARYDWPSDGILVGNGSNELIQASLAVTLEGGDRVVAPSPTFSLYRLLTNVFGGRYVPVALGPDFRYQIDSLIEVAARERARVVVLNSPNNPTGSALPPDAVERVLAATDALVVCDEAYQEFGGPSAVGLLGASPRVVVLRTLSKAFGLAGLRLGFALAHPAVAREIAKAKLPYNVNALSLTAATTLLAHPETAAHVAEIVATRDRGFARLRGIPALNVYPSAANFILVRCLTLPAREVFRRLLHDHGILVRDVSAAPELAECLRISVGTPEDMDAVVDALGEILGRA
ncbi:MAG TPA: histidinol-phosphate transaminase [Gemmatimonadales bacterium]|nr:histidinol-phosphate transaminase [Gemmatimonadales bacterium]